MAGHDLTALGTASLDTMGGLISFCAPEDLPESASPRTWDTDFFVGSVITRPGISSVFSYAQSFVITSVQISYGTITFIYAPSTGEPLVNEGFVFTGFTGGAAVINNRTFVATYVNPSANTFQADSDDLPSGGPYTNQTGTATSTSGLFVGPNVGGSAYDVPGDGNSWSNPQYILSNVPNEYAEAITGVDETTGPVVPTQTNGTPPHPLSNAWLNTGNVLTTGSSFTTASLLPGQSSTFLFANDCPLSIPTNATINGITVTAQASATNHAGMSIQLISDVAPLTTIGVTQEQHLESGLASFSFGGALYLWGAYLTPAIVNAAGFGVAILATAGNAASIISVNSLSMTVYYSTGPSEALQVTEFSFSIPHGAGVTGIGVSFSAFTTNTSSVTLQLLNSRRAVGKTQTQTLSTTPEIYTLGSHRDNWDYHWLPEDINSLKFGVQVVSTGNGTTSINDLDITVYVTPSLSNFNYVKSYGQNNGQLDTLALDSNGFLWTENVTNNPGYLSIALSGISPNTYAKSATADDREYICFSDLGIGTDRPRVYDGTNFYPLSQVGPGVTPAFCATTSTGAGQINITSYSISASTPTDAIITYTYNSVASPPVVVVANQLYTILGNTPFVVYDWCQTNTVLTSPVPSSSVFSMSLPYYSAGVNVPTTTIVGTASLAYNYTAGSIVQNLVNLGAQAIHQNNSSTIQYVYNKNGPVDSILNAAFTKGTYPVYVYVVIPEWKIQGTYQVTAVSTPVTAGGTAWSFFEFNYGTVENRQLLRDQLLYLPPVSELFDDTTYQMTIATVYSETAIPNISAGTSIQILSASPPAWNNVYTVKDTLNNCGMDINATQMILNSDGSYTAQYTYAVSTTSSPQTYPQPGELVTIQNCNGSPTGGVSPFNGTFVIYSYGPIVENNVTPNNTSLSGTFQVYPLNGMTAGGPYDETNNGVATTFGTQFLIDPGDFTIGSTGSVNSPIYSPLYSYGTAQIIVDSAILPPIGSGTRQGVCFFITESGYETAPSPLGQPATFSISGNVYSISASGIPIGPPNTIARGISFTEAGQNGVPGASFYVIPEDVTQVINGVTTAYTSTIINDNVSTSATFSFTDNVLLNSTEIDIQGNDLFNLIELGSCAWCVPYASRMFYGLQLNKVDNFNNLTFDGGFLNITTPAPTGWLIDTGSLSQIKLVASTIAGNSLYVFNSTPDVIPSAGLMGQTAYQDTLKVSILESNTAYSVRVTASNPSGNTAGTLTISLSNYNSGLEPPYSPTYGSFSVPLGSMTTLMQAFTGSLLAKSVFPGSIPAQLYLTLQVTGLGPGAGCEIDRIEVFPTEEPYLKTQVYGSYIDNMEAIDASGNGGIIDTAGENPQACMGGFVMHDKLFLLKTDSMYWTEDDPTSEPGGWGLREVSNKVGAVGINSYDIGEEWAIMACRAGIYGFDGGQPIKISHEIWNIWNLINWAAGDTIVLRNDVVNRRILCAVPLPTPNMWLPFDPPNPAPDSPNVMLMLNYMGLNTIGELLSQPQMHVTMFGTLASIDMKRKWSIWRIPTPYMDFISRQAVEDKPLMICNGTLSSKIYQLLDDQLSDDGVAIWGLYCTYGHVNAVKAATQPLFGMHRKQYTIWQACAEGAGSMGVVFYPDTLGAKYPILIPPTGQPAAYPLPLTNSGITLSSPAMQDYFRPINVTANRMFCEYSTNAVGSWFQLHKTLLSGKAAPWSPLNPTGGGNSGIV